jgi:hypothetical protein
VGGGDPGAAAEACGSTVSMLYKRREDYGGSLPEDRLPEIALGVKEALGVDLPPAFLTADGPLPDPREAAA